MKIGEIRERSDKELAKFLAEKREYLRDIRFKIASKQYKNHNNFGVTKRDIARLLTVLKERDLMKE